MGQKSTCWGLLRRRQCPVPTWRGWLALVLVCTGFTWFAARKVHPFLALNAPVPGGVLVVEGWGRDQVMRAALAEFHRNHYSKLYVTGLPMERGALLADYKNYADLGVATLVKLGLATNSVEAVPAPSVIQDRTYAMALGLKRGLHAHGLPPAKVNIITDGPHARRSRLLFQKALGKQVSVGVLAVPVDDYDPQRWWCSSEGVRTVIGEALAYGYARFLFRAPKD